MRAGSIVGALALAAAAAAAAETPAAAHGMRTAYIEITEASPGRAAITVRGKLPVLGVDVEAAPPCAVAVDPSAGRVLRCPGPIAGAELTIRGLGPIASEAVVLVALASGETATTLITPAAARWQIPGDAPGPLAVARRYVGLGVHHIATGVDHLLFLLALVLCLRTLRAVVFAETAFTLSHSLSFTASALGWVHVSAAAAEACIAVSLVLVALDVGAVRRAPPSHAAALAFVFGLVHGLGFAGGLGELGLPATEVPAALLGFAGGVELGQIAFLALAIGALGLATRIPRAADAIARVGAYAIGGVGWFWLLERLGALRA